LHDAISMAVGRGDSGTPRKPSAPPFTFADKFLPGVLR